jgi:hypothetical protein
MPQMERDALSLTARKDLYASLWKMVVLAHRAGNPLVNMRYFNPLTPKNGDRQKE